MPGWVLFGVGVAAAAVGGAFHGLAAQRRAQLGNMAAGSTYDSSLQTYQQERIATFVGYGVGGLSLGVGLGWLLWPDE